MHKTVAILGLSFLLAGATGAAAQDASGWCKSKWGADDEKGAANHLSPQLALDAAKLVKTGKVYPLGVETNAKTPAYPPRTFNITILQPGQTGGSGLGPTKTTINEDNITGWVGSGSQLDGLGHTGCDQATDNATSP